MRRLLALIFPILFLVAPQIDASNQTQNELEFDNLVGSWSGMWDGAFGVRFLVLKSKNPDEFSIVYQWQEHPDKPFEQTTRRGVVFNQNTIDAGNISLIINPQDPTRAVAIGKFKQRTRLAPLKKDAKN